MSTFVVDTQALFWYLTGSPRLGPRFPFPFLLL
jgi:hypothetical protein